MEESYYHLIPSIIGCYRCLLSVQCLQCLLSAVCLCNVNVNAKTMKMKTDELWQHLERRVNSKKKIKNAMVGFG